MNYKLIFLFLLWTGIAQAQYWEAGVLVGASNYIGELQQGNLVPSEYNLSLGMAARYNASPRLAIQTHLLQCRISGKDANATLRQEQFRNLSFRADIIELGVQGEFNLAPFHVPARKITAPYIFAGVGGFYFNPQAQIRGQWYDLQPLGTEGQGLADYPDLKKYSLFQVAIPFGFGIKFAMSSRVNIGFEFGLRKTFTDYLDDVGGNYPDLRLLDPLVAELSYREPENIQENIDFNPIGEPRGDPSDKDAYLIGQFSLTFNLADRYGMDFDKKYDVFKEYIPEQDADIFDDETLKEKPEFVAPPLPKDELDFNENDKVKKKRKKRSKKKIDRAVETPAETSPEVKPKQSKKKEKKPEKVKKPKKEKKKKSKKKDNKKETDENIIF